jgi:glycosyltransferase involved in cell wall biosynthesis
LARAEVAPLAVEFVSSHAKLGGGERYLEGLVGLLGSGWVRRVVALEHGPFAERLGADVVPTGGRWPSIFASARRLRRLLQRDRPDVVHANGIKAALVTVLATVGTRLPVVWVKHDFSYDGPLARLVARRARLVVAVSAALTETFGPEPPPKVRVVHTGVEDSGVDRVTARNHLLEVLGAPEPEAVVALAGRLHPVKGHEELLAAAPEVLDRFPRTRLAFIGGEDPSTRAYATRLRGRVRALGLEHAVTFLGHRTDAIELLAGCEVAVIPSVRVNARMGREGFPLTGLELLEVGTPIVGYADGGLPELVGECGLLVPSGDRQALAAGIVSLLDNREVRERLGRCGRTRVRERFTVESWLEAMKNVYREAAGR